MSYFQDLLTSIFERGATGVRHHDDRSLEVLAAALMSERGEVSGHKIAAALLDRFDQSDDAERLAFFNLLASEYDVNTAGLIQAASTYQNEPSQHHYSQLREVSAPRRQTLLRRLNSVPGATEKLVRMREALSTGSRSTRDLERVDLDFKHAFSSWFNRGFLVMRPVNWNSPASLLEKITAYEAVHTINDWEDLRRRLQPPDRRCFAFFHPAMPDEPLIFVEVALTSETPASIQEVLAEDRDPIDVSKANTAVFYSISNCQSGLRGVSFGNFLIKQVVDDLADSLPQLNRFLTLSAVPGIVSWARKAIGDAKYLDIEAGIKLIESIADGGSTNLAPAQRDLVMSAAAHYFVEARRSDGLPFDPVSRFHLGNGASLDNIHWMADSSAKGLKHSAGLMVNYLYDLNKIEENHESYARDQQVLTSRSVRGLVPKEKRGSKLTGEPG